MKRIILAVVATAFVAVAVTPALAGGHKNRPGKRPALEHARVFAARGGGHLLFVGNLTAAPGSGATSLTFSVSGGDREALRKMLGQSTTQTFAVSGDTKVQKVGAGAAQLSDLAEGDLVWIEVRAPRNAALADVEKQAASRVVDRGQRKQGVRTIAYAFTGTLTATGSSSLSLDVAGGTSRALRLMIAQPSAQTFAIGSSTSVFRAENRRAARATLADLRAGDRVQVVVRAADDATLAQVEASAAQRVVARAAAAGAA